MSPTATLAANRYRAVFCLERAPRSTDHADVTIALCLDDATEPMFTSPPSFVAADDLRRLLRYLDDHLALLVTRPNGEGIVFCPLELGFQLQALGGEVDGDGGEFTLRLMVNARRPGTGEESVYLGCEGSVDVAAVRAFAAELVAALAALQL